MDGLCFHVVHAPLCAFLFLELMVIMNPGGTCSSCSWCAVCGCKSTSVYNCELVQQFFCGIGLFHAVSHLCVSFLTRRLNGYWVDCSPLEGNSKTFCQKKLWSWFVMGNLMIQIVATLGIYSGASAQIVGHPSIMVLSPSFWVHSNPRVHYGHWLSTPWACSYPKVFAMKLKIPPMRLKKDNVEEFQICIRQCILHPAEVASRWTFYICYLELSHRVAHVDVVRRSSFVPFMLK